MPTIEDLRDVLAMRANAAGNGDEVLSRVAATPRQTRHLAPLVAAVGIVALAVGGVALGRLTDEGPASTGGAAGQVARPDGHFAWQFAIGPIDGYTVTRSGSQWLSSDTDPAIGGYQQFARIDSSTHSKVSGRYTYEPAAIDYPANFARDISIAVTVSGEPGYFTLGRHVAQDGLRADLYAHPWVAARDGTDYWPELRWQNPDGTWNLISGTFGFDPATYDYNNDVARSTLFTIAKSVRIGVDQPVDVPFRLTNLPAGLVPAELDYLHGAPCIGYLGPEDPVDGDNPVIACRLADTDAAQELDPQTRPSSLSDADVSGRDIGDGTTLLLVFRSSNTVLSATQRSKLLDDADVSPSLADPATWLPVSG